MSIKADRVLKRLAKKSHRGFQGYPQVKIGFYGPNNKKATTLKLKASLAEDEPWKLISKWDSEIDMRKNAEILCHIDNLIRDQKIPTISMTTKILGCPHERGEDYGYDSDCPSCSYWVGKQQEE